MHLLGAGEIMLKKTLLIALVVETAVRDVLVIRIKLSVVRDVTGTTKEPPISFSAFWK